MSIISGAISIATAKASRACMPDEYVLIGSFIQSPSSENSIIRGSMPRAAVLLWPSNIAPMTALSRPESSWENPSCSDSSEQVSGLA